jgi:uncharacterized membrane protein
MTGNQIPEDVRRFIVTSIPSVPYLEALLLLRNTATQVWNADLLSQRLYISSHQAADLLEALCARGFLQRAESTKAFSYAPDDPHLRAAVDQLDAAYQVNLIGITHLIHSNSSKKLQQFADAFRWRRD